MINTTKHFCILYLWKEFNQWQRSIYMLNSFFFFLCQMEQYRSTISTLLSCATNLTRFVFQPRHFLNLDECRYNHMIANYTFPFLMKYSSVCSSRDGFSGILDFYLLDQWTVYCNSLELAIGSL